VEAIVEEGERPYPEKGTENGGESIRLYGGSR